jgi:hypothetical protein
VLFQGSGEVAEPRSGSLVSGSLPSIRSGSTSADTRTSTVVRVRDSGEVADPVWGSLGSCSSPSTRNGASSADTPTLLGACLLAHEHVLRARRVRDSGEVVDPFVGGVGCDA